MKNSQGRDMLCMHFLYTNVLSLLENMSSVEESFRKAPIRRSFYMRYYQRLNFHYNIWGKGEAGVCDIPIFFLYMTRFDHFSHSPLNYFVSIVSLSLPLTFFFIWYIQSKAYDVKNTFAIDLICLVSICDNHPWRVFWVFNYILAHFHSPCNIIIFFTFQTCKVNWISHLYRSNTNNFSEEEVNTCWSYMLN